MSLTNESVVVITGAASGIGRALAVRLAEENIAGIAIADVNESGISETAALISNPRVKLTTHTLDVSNEDDFRVFAENVIAQHGRATHLVNNAGVALGGRVAEVSLEDMRWLMSINFWGVVYGTKIFLPHLLAQKSAHIVNISSIFGIVAPPGNATYSASKFAVRGFTESLRHELDDNPNITVSTVHPGGIATNIANSARIGAGVSATKEALGAKLEKFNKQLAATTPTQAAETIVKGIKSKHTRILIGADAKALSFFARLFPRRYLQVVNLVTGGRLRDDR